MDEKQEESGFKIWLGVMGLASCVFVGMAIVKLWMVWF